MPKWQRQLRERGDHFQGLLSVLENFSFSSDVTNPRDRVYAFLGLQESDLPRFKADYTVSTDAAYRKLHG
jgi:hypothetical protein